MLIFTTFDPDEDCYRLMVADARMATAPAGPRLFRATPHPAIRFEHATREGAEIDAAILRAYLDHPPKGE